jgi:protease I
MPVNDKRVAVLLEQLYEDREFWYPYLRMREAGAQTVSIAPEAGKTYHGKHGVPARSDLGIEEANADDLDAVIIPGGYAPDHMRRNEAMVRLVREMHEAGKTVAAICHGGWMLASAAILEGRNATCFFAIRDDLVNAGAEWLDREVVRDGNLVTSRVPDDLPAFCRTVLEALSESP